MKIKFVKQDQWIGRYYKDEVTITPFKEKRVRTNYLCLIPCFPIVWKKEYTTNTVYDYPTDTRIER